ncbi:hypothetical protein CRN67_07890 [Campylobacter blaseri]|uniref:Probable membrane transporter protein n=2 Tax=Campylobacter blaseri TaxID=2042961 RepID=A0A2P8QZ44_9BACT|nr:hypothetical protein CQ405_07885 [Campylobacter blaseri]PSM52973.1 hypothetical protein CRN67_07890 [Campylobacter blaseri]
MLFFSALGSFVGIVAGMFGIGGGGIMVPILAWIFLKKGISPDLIMHLALGSSMASIIVTTFSSFNAHNKRNSVHWGLFKMIVPGVIIGAFLGSFVASKISSIYLAILFSVFMFYSSIRMFFSKNSLDNKEHILPNIVQLFSGGFIGLVSAIISIGGGILTVPYLTWQGVDVKKAIGTSSAVGFALSIGGAIGYVFNGLSITTLSDYNLGYVNLVAFFFISFFSYFTAPLGVKLIHKIPSKNVKKIFALLPFVLSIKMVLELIKG